MAQPWPAWVHTMAAAISPTVATSASSRTTYALLPPSSRNTLFTVADAAAITRRPTAVDPVKLIMSTPGWAVSASPTAAPDDDSTFTTPAGMSVRSATRRPSASADHGVSGAPLSTTVHPAASAGASLARLIWVGKL